MSAKYLFPIAMGGFFIIYLSLMLRQPSFTFQEGDIFFQAEDGIRDVLGSRGLGDVYKRQVFDVFNSNWN